MGDQPMLDEIVTQIQNLVHMSPATLVSLRELISTEQGLKSATRTTWRKFLLDLPVDERSFDDRLRYTVGKGTWNETLQALQDWCISFRGLPADAQAEWADVFGFLAFLLLTMLALQESNWRRHQTSNEFGNLSKDAPTTSVRRAHTHDCDKLCAPLFAHPAVQSLVHQVYYPNDPADDDLAKTEWGNINFSTLEFYRHGTTSLILHGKGLKSKGKTENLALKLIIYPFLRIRQIVDSTRSYVTDYNVEQGDVKHLVHIWASAGSWVLMDFVDGIPLDELLAHEATSRVAAGKTSWLRRQLAQQRESGPERILLLNDLEAYGNALFDAMEELEKRLTDNNKEGGLDSDLRAPRTHGDLTPSNIIVTSKEDAFSFHLIDLGVNYLYTYAVGGFEGSDARFVAPEIKTDGRSGNNSDLYSLGHLLILFGTGTVVSEVVPDEFYVRAPMLARLLEDLIDRKPEQRLLLFVPPGSTSLSAHLKSCFNLEINAVRAAETAGTAPSDERWLHATLDLFQTRLTLGLFRPLAGVPGQLRRIHRTQKEGKEGTNTSWPGNFGRLLFWSRISTVMWALSFSVTVTWIIRQTNWEWGNRAVEALQILRGSSKDEFPFLDSLRAHDYRWHDFAYNAPILCVCLTYAMIGAKYYQNLFGQLTPLVVGWRAGELTWRAAIAQFFMRLMTVAPALLILPVVLIEPGWWPIDTAIGQTIVFFCNGTAMMFTRSALSRARDRDIATVPASDSKITGMQSFGEWVPASLLYAAIVWIIGLLIFTNVLRGDVFAWTVAAINLFLFYLIKCGRGAAEVRVVLTRATLAAERLRHLSRIHR